MDQSRNDVFTPLTRGHLQLACKCGFKHRGAGSHVLCAGLQTLCSAVLCGFPEKSEKLLVILWQASERLLQSTVVYLTC